jgi:hypothetical protein
LVQRYLKKPGTAGEPASRSVLLQEPVLGKGKALAVPYDERVQQPDINER